MFSWLVKTAIWPVLLLSHFWFTFVFFDGFGWEHSTSKHVGYGCTLVLVFLFEEILPHNSAWSTLAHGSEGLALDKKVDVFPFITDWFHGLAGPTVAFELTRPLMRSAWWPALGVTSELPFLLQLILSLLISDFFAYWQHRLAHLSELLWPFHAVHHHAKRLYSVNTVRFHVIDMLARSLFTQGLLYTLGFGEHIIDIVVVAKAAVGLLSHSNIDANCGWLNYVFNTPENHLWHHSTSVKESNSNYSELFVLWDVIFGTFYHPSRPTPRALGRARYDDQAHGLKTLPKTPWGQFLMPFVYASQARWANVMDASLADQ